jgi:hypothetical protein
MNGSTLTLALAAGLAACVAAQPAARRSPERGSPTRIKLRGFDSTYDRDSEDSSDASDASTQDVLSLKVLSPTRATVEKHFFDALEEEAGVNQVVYMGPFVMVGDRMGGIYGNLELHIRHVGLKYELGVHLGFLGVPKNERRSGRGSTLLGIVVAAADAVGLPMDLDVKPTTMHGDAKAPVSKRDLRTFYGRFGFKPVKGMEADYLFRPAKAVGHMSKSGSRSLPLPRGVPEMTTSPPDIQEQIASFRATFPPELCRTGSGRGRCEDESKRFAYSIPGAQIVRITWRYLNGRRKGGKRHVAVGHDLVLIDGVGIDWTANQFANPEETFPVPYVILESDIEAWAEWIDAEVHRKKYEEPEIEIFPVSPNILSRRRGP